MGMTNNVLNILHSPIQNLPFAFQKLSFCNAKGHELECKSLAFKSQLISPWLSTDYEVCLGCGFCNIISQYRSGRIFVIKRLFAIIRTRIGDIRKICVIRQWNKIRSWAWVDVTLREGLQNHLGHIGKEQRISHCHTTPRNPNDRFGINSWLS